MNRWLPISLALLLLGCILFVSLFESNPTALEWAIMILAFAIGANILVILTKPRIDDDLKATLTALRPQHSTSKGIELTSEGERKSLPDPLEDGYDLPLM